MDHPPLLVRTLVAHEPDNVLSGWKDRLSMRLGSSPNKEGVVDLPTVYIYTKRRHIQWNPSKLDTIGTE